MRMSLQPMQYLAQNCTECDQPLSSPNNALSDRKFTSEMIGILGAEEAINLAKNQRLETCRKCGQTYER